MIRAVYVAVGIVLALGAIYAILTYQPPAPPPSASAPVTQGAAPIGQFALIEGGDFTQVAPVDGKGAPVDMSPYRGKALLVNLWATWCAPCVEELPSLGKLQAARGGDDFAVVTIAIDERDASKIEPFLASHGASNLPVLIDMNRTIDKVAAVSALPTTLLVDPDGKVRAMLAGDARWHCGKALETIEAFIKDGTVKQEVLAECE